MSYNIHVGGVTEQLATLPEQHFHCCVTSPPYWGLRDYGVEGQIGLEKTPEEYVDRMVEVMRGVWRVLRDDGTLWLNVGDSYANNTKWGGATSGKHVDALHGEPVGRGKRNTGLKPKDLCLIPYRLILALQADGWWVRSQIAWTKKSAMPESVRDRPSSAWEPIFLLTKSARYFYDGEAVRQGDKGRSAGNQDNLGTQQRRMTGGAISGGTKSEPWTPGTGANLRNHWHLGPEPYPDAHFATFPTEIPRRAILAGTSAKGCCPECGAPWERVVERKEYGCKVDHSQDAIVGMSRNQLGGQAVYDSYVPPQTTGWRPACGHNLGPVPCRVFDPFLGSGTTCLVAEQLGRDSTGIELNPEYAKMADARVQAGVPVTARTDQRRGDGLPLFAQRGPEETT